MDSKVIIKNDFIFESIDFNLLEPKLIFFFLNILNSTLSERKAKSNFGKKPETSEMEKL